MKLNGLRIWMLLFVLAALLFYAVSCSDDDDDDSDDDDSSVDDDDDDDDAVDDDDDDDDNNDNDDDIPFDVVVDRILVRGADAPPNPENGAPTPGAFNRFPVYRFRQDTGDGPPRPVKGIMIFVPGYAAGASDFFTVAKNIVTMSDGDFEAWCTERRANLLEDQVGLNAAEASGDPRIAQNYYFGGAQVEGQTFAGFLENTAPITDMISEWGLELHLQDLRALIEHVPAQNRATNIFIGGHSRGGRFSQMYAAFEFPDNHRGTQDLAGILLLDAAGDVEPLGELEYLVALDRIRKGKQGRCGVLERSGDGIGFVVGIEVLAMVASAGFGQGDPQVGPDGFWPNWGGFESLFPLLTRFNDVQLTNAAHWGLLFDNDSTPGLNNFYGHMGALIGGELCEDFIGQYPCEDGATYSWLPFDQTLPEEKMDLQNFLKLIYEGESDFTEWYYPSRLNIEDHCADTLETQGQWQDDYFSFSNAQVDAAVFALEGFTAFNEDAYEAYRQALGPVRGSDKSRAEIGFEVIELHDWGHIEVLLTEPDRNPFLDAYLEFMDHWSQGEVQVPLFDE